MRDKLKDTRKRAGFTQQQIADMLNVSRAHYTRIESGNRNPSLKIAIKIKEILSYSQDDIFFAA